MADRLVLVPGTSGTKLLLNSNDFGWPAEVKLKSWVLGNAHAKRIVRRAGISSSQLVDAMSMEFADPGSYFATKTTLLHGKAMTSGPVLNVVYNQFRDFMPFTYDWRSDVRGSAKQLLRFLVDNKPTGGRHRLIGHSQGGLVIVCAARMAAKGDPTAFSRLVSRVVLLAVPLAGTQNAARAFVDAENLGGTFSESFREIALSWPALYQMLPTWRGSVLLQDGSDSLSGMMSDATWNGYSVSANKLLRARQTRKHFLANPLKWMQGVDVRIVMSRSYTTVRQARVHGTGLSYDAVQTEPGDTLVPYDTTVKKLPAVWRENVVTFGEPYDGKTLKHFAIANDPAIASFCRNFLEA